MRLGTKNQLDFGRDLHSDLNPGILFFFAYLQYVITTKTDVCSCVFQLNNIKFKKKLNKTEALTMYVK